MLNEIMQNEELRNRRLVDLYEEGILELGDEVPYAHREESYVSLGEKNGFGNQEFSTKGLDMKWQAIGVENIDGNKCLKLIAKDPVFSEFVLKGARGCVYGVNEMHRICSLFATGDGALKGRSITIEDVNQLLEVVVDKKRRIVYQKGYKENICHLNDAFLKEMFFYNIHTPESYLQRDETRTRKKITGTYYRYYINSIIGKEKEKNIVCRNTSYFLASLGTAVITALACASFGPGCVYYYGVVAASTGLFNSNGLLYSFGNCDVDASRFAVRPILYLKSRETFSSLLERKDYKSNKS